jgi:hypothetical protein
MLKNIHHFILQFDAVGPGPELNYKGNTRYSSLIGVILSFSAFSLALLTIKFTLISFINKKNPDVFITDIYDEEEIISVNSSNYKFFINVVYLDNKTFQHININFTEFEAPHVSSSRFDGKSYINQ